MISIITVCYNAGKEIVKTLESILVQESKTFEYVIVDGKSRDKTVDIISKYLMPLNNEG